MSPAPSKAESAAVESFLTESFKAGGKVNLTLDQKKEFGAWLLANPTANDEKKSKKYLAYRSDNTGSGKKTKKKGAKR
jgi:hypothetical protein